MELLTFHTLGERINIKDVIKEIKKEIERLTK